MRIEEMNMHIWAIRNVFLSCAALIFVIHFSSFLLATLQTIHFFSRSLSLHTLRRAHSNYVTKQ